MDPWICATLISLAGGLGGIVNALLTSNKFILPKLMNGISCPGFVSNLLIGATSAFSSWSFYGAGATIELAKTYSTTREEISLTFAAFSRAFLAGVAGAKWLTGEVDKRLLKESVKKQRKKPFGQECEEIAQQSPRKIPEELQYAS